MRYHLHIRVRYNNVDTFPRHCFDRLVLKFRREEATRKHVAVENSLHLTDIDAAAVDCRFNGGRLGYKNCDIGTFDNKQVRDRDFTTIDQSVLF